MFYLKEQFKNLHVCPCLHVVHVKMLVLLFIILFIYLLVCSVCLKDLDLYLNWCSNLPIHYVTWQLWFTSSCVLSLQPVKKKHRARIIEFFIDVAQECFNIGNFNSLMAIISEYSPPENIQEKRQIVSPPHCLNDRWFLGNTVRNHHSAWTCVSTH